MSTIRSSSPPDAGSSTLPTPTALPRTSATCDRSDRRSLRRFATATLALVALYAIAGTFGRFPWKADEPYSFGIVWSMLDDGAWLVPTIAGQHFLEKPPLVYWLGAAFARALPWAPPYESARVAVIALFGATVAAIYFAARWLAPEAAIWQRTFARAECARERPAAFARVHGLLAIALVVGTAGFAEHVHKLTADVGQLAGATMGLAALVHIGASLDRRSIVTTGALLGAGAGLAFMSKGLFVPGLLGATLACCLPMGAYRSKDAFRTYLVAIGAALPWLLAWPAWLHAVEPALFREWFWDNNVGRFVGSTRLGGNAVPLEARILSVLGMGFPALLLAAATLARTAFGLRRERFSITRDAPAHACVAIYLVVSLGSLGVSASMRDVYLLPAIPPMILLALPGLRRDAPASSNVLRTIVATLFALAAIAVFALWLALVTRGDLIDVAAVRALVARWLPLPFALPVSVGALAASIVALIVWREVMRNDPWRSVTLAWCAGFGMLWIVTCALLLPWIDTARSYAATFASLRPYLEAQPGCVATMNFGESELALFAYVTHITPMRAFEGRSGVGKRSRPNAAAFACPWRLVRSNRTWDPVAPPGDRWERVWEGARPADRVERFALYRARAKPRE